MTVCVHLCLLVLVRLCAHAQEPNLISYKTNIHRAPFGNDPVVKSGCPAVTSQRGSSHILATAHPVCRTLSQNSERPHLAPCLRTWWRTSGAQIMANGAFMCTSDVLFKWNTPCRFMCFLVRYQNMSSILVNAASYLTA